MFWLVTSLLLTDVTDLHRCLFAATTDSEQRTPYYSVCVLSIETCLTLLVGVEALIASLFCYRENIY